VWTAANIEIELEAGFTEGSLVTARIRTPAGDLILMADVERFDRELVLAGLHMHGENMRANRLGWARLRQIALAVAEKLDVDTILVKGAARTTGSVPGRFPSPIRFTRPIPTTG
jgi:hypothetical protein